MNSLQMFFMTLMLFSPVCSYTMTQEKREKIIGSIVDEADVRRLRTCVPDELNIGDTVVVQGRNNKSRKQCYYGKISTITYPLYFIDIHINKFGRCGRYCTIDELFLVDEESTNSNPISWHDDGSDSEKDEQKNFIDWDSPTTTDDEMDAKERKHASTRNKQSLSALLLSNLQQLIQGNPPAEKNQRKRFQNNMQYWQARTRNGE